MEQSIGNRILLLRKHKELSQTEFADKIGLKHAAISVMELGKIYPTEQNIKHICLTFGVNESWLRDGTGDMLDKDISAEEMELLNLYRNMSDRGKQALLFHADYLVDLEQSLHGSLP
jgi:transcriptional regulator with XRE-family HTH domain